MKYGVGYCSKKSKTYGDINNKCYLTWRNMLKRCYSSEPKYENYRLLGITVCDEWLDYSVFEKWFERVNDNIEKSESKQIWSGWRPITTNNALWCVRNIYRANRANNDMIYVQYLCNKYISTSDTDIWYRTKGNQVQVMFKFDNGTSVVANAKCNTKGGDTFDIKKGIGLGVLRCFIKTMIKDLDNIIRTL